MRRFTDADGREWDVVLGRESWGVHYALFVPRGRTRSATSRQDLLDASGYGAAETALARMWLEFFSGGLDSPAARRAVSAGFEHIERALSIAPDDPDALAVRAHLTYWRWRLIPADSASVGAEVRREAEEQLRRLLETDPTRARAWTDLSAVLQARGAFAEARWAAERALRADAYLDRTGSLTPRLFETALETGDLSAAETWCDRLAEGPGGRGVAAYCSLALVAWSAEEGGEGVSPARDLLDTIPRQIRDAPPWGPRMQALMAVI
ncbi:MAG: hypothetical protein ACOC8B_02145, partial [Gemmatimonadota bacterium]